MKRTKRECWIGEDGYCHVPLANGKGEAICDAEFLEEVNKHSWSISSKYAKTGINSKKHITLHKFIFLLKYGCVKKGFCLDHKNRNTLDNKISNLRIATYSQNSMNTKIKGKFKGVCFHNKKKKYVAQININKKNFYLGFSDDEEACAIMYDIAAFHHFGDFAVLNFPEKINEYKEKTPPELKHFKNGKTSKFIGVSFNKSDNKFTASCYLNHLKKHIGNFDDETSAACARDIFIINNNLNLKLNFSLETYEEQLSQEPKQLVLFKAS